MSEGLGIIIVVAIIAFLIWLIGKIISIALFVIIVIPIYIVLSFYAGVKFIAMNLFIALDKLFYLGFDVPVIAVWIFWGLLIGAAIQGCREMKIYGQKRIGILIAVAPILLLVFVGGIKTLTAHLLSDVPTNVAAVKQQSVKSQKGPVVDSKTSPTPLSSSVTEGMVLIPAGEFEMGSKGDPFDKIPVHTVYVDAFYMDQYEVTNAQYANFLNLVTENASAHYYFGAHPQHQADNQDKNMIRIKYIDGRYQASQGYENHPVNGVTWHGAMAYAAWAQKRLPTEAEWERAARGGLEDKAYPWGDAISIDNANYNHDGGTTSIGHYLANGYGLYDMAGNVSEWCLDAYDEAFYITSPRKNPIVGGSLTSILTNWPDVESPRVVRGGCWLSDTEALKCASRSYGEPQGDRLTLFSGFRCVKAVSSLNKE